MAKSEPSVIRGALTNVVMRWTDRLISFVSTIILARLLVPDDFGIIAMAYVLIELVNVFLDLGVHVALIQNREASQDHYDSAWTLRLIQTSLATMIVFLSSPLAAVYFKDPRVTPVLQVLCFSFLLGGLENIGVITFQKEMKFGLEFRFSFLKRIIGFVITIVAALLLRSYWALVIGTIMGRMFGVALSYVLHSMRPKLSVKKFREIFAVSQWMVVRSCSFFLESSLHKIIVGRRETSSVMGAYTLANEISALPTTELLAPLNRVLFPLFVQVKHDLLELKRVFLLSQELQVLVGLPASVGLALVANEVVRLMLGEKWLIAIAYIQILAIVNVITSIKTSWGYVLLTLGRIRTLAVYAWIQVAFFAVGAFFVFPTGGAMKIAWLRLIISLAGIVLFPWLLMQALPVLRLWDMLRSVLRPLIAVGAMAVCVTSLGSLTGIPLLLVLLIKIVIGALSYIIVELFLWRIVGRPEGAESYILAKIGFSRFLVSS